MWAAAIGAGATAIALVAAWVLHTRVRAWLPEDHPAPGRKRHARPTAMAGFVPAVCAAVMAVVVGLGWLAAGIVVAGVVGGIDDRAKDAGRDGIGWMPKAGGLAVAVGLAVVGSGVEGVGTMAAAMLFAFVVTNAVNFLDNQDGVATVLGVVAIAVVGGGEPTHPASVLAACWAPFLAFNWPHARLFLGDAGAYALGLCAAGMALGEARGGAGVDWVAAAAPVAVPLVDFVQVVTARCVLGYAPWVGDRRHVTHLLLNVGVPRVWLAPVLGGCAVAVGVWAG